MKVVKLVKYRRLNPRYSTHVSWGGAWKEVRHLQTVERWLKTHRTGTFVVRTRGHAFAVVDGVVMGYHKPKARILTTIKLARVA